MLWSMESQRVRHDLMTKQHQSQGRERGADASPLEANSIVRQPLLKRPIPGTLFDMAVAIFNIKDWQVWM